MTKLDVLAEEVGVHGRTLRRAAARGLLRSARRGAREVLIPPGERSYVRTHWPLVASLLEALRKQPNVRLAVLYGSAARGSDRPDSDLDILVRLRRDDHGARSELAEALQEASGRRAQLVSVDQAEDAPMLLADVLRDGRVLVDRDEDWRRLKRRERRIIGAARSENERVQELAWGVPVALEESLPRKIAVRLADVRRHYEALAHFLELTSKEQFIGAARTADPEALGGQVYPLERAFEILCNYVSELNELGLEEAGLTAGDRPTNLRLLGREKVLGSERTRRWRAILEARNELQHEYPDVRASGIYHAAIELADDFPAYIRAYVDWMRRLGFGSGR